MADLEKDNFVILVLTKHLTLIFFDLATNSLGCRDEEERRRYCESVRCEFGSLFFITF